MQTSEQHSTHLFLPFVGDSTESVHGEALDGKSLEFTFEGSGECRATPFASLEGTVSNHYGIQTKSRRRSSEFSNQFYSISLEERTDVLRRNIGNAPLPPDARRFGEQRRDFTTSRIRLQRSPR